MRVLVCGSRDWEDVLALVTRLNALDRDAIIVHGACPRGADHMASVWAQVQNRQEERYPADWAKYDKRAGYVRNAQMVDTKPDLVLAFSKNNSRGTANTIMLAIEAGIPVEVFLA